MISEIKETYEEIKTRKRAELEASIERGDLADPIFTPAFFISLGVSAALSTASYFISRAVTPKQRIQQGQLSGSLQLQNSEQGLMIPEIYGASPTVSLTAGINPTYQNVANSATEADGGITKNAGGANWNAGASHNISVTAGVDAFFEFTVLSGYACAGFSTTASPVSGNTDFIYGLQWNPDGGVTIKYSNTLLVANVTTWATGDRFRVELRSGRFRAYKGSAEIRPQNFVPPTPVYPLYCGIAIFTVGAGASEAKVKIGSIGLPSNAGRGGIRVSAIIVWTSGIRKHVSTTQQPTGGGKGGSRTTTVENITYDIDLGLMWSRGPVGLLREFANADVLIDQVTTSLLPSGVYDPTTGPDPNYDPTVPPDPEPNYLIPQERANSEIPYDVDAVGSGTIQGGGSLFTIYEGNSTQDPDPTIEADIDAKHGTGSTPAYRNHSLIVHKNFLLSRWGGIVPNMTAVWEHKTLKTLDDIYGSLTERVGLISSDYDYTSLSSINCRGLLLTGRLFQPAEIIDSEEIRTAYSYLATEGEGKILGYAEGSEPTVTIPDTEVGWLDSDQDLPDVVPEVESRIAQETTLARQVDVKFIDPDNQWEPNTQSAKRQITDGVGVQLLEVQLCMLADEARAAAQRKLYKDYVAGTAHKFTLSWAYMYLYPGYKITITRAEGFSHVLRLTSISGGVGVLECEGIALEPETYNQPATGAFNGLPDLNIQAPAMTVAMLLDIPLIRDGDATFNDGILQYAVGMPRTGFDQSWRGWALYISRLNEWMPLITSEVPGTVGTVVSATSLSTDPDTIDNTGEIIVDLYGTTATLSSVAEADMGLNQALAGNMIFNFADAVQVADHPNRWSLTTLLNGQKDTSAHIPLVVAGDRFVFLDEAVKAVPMELADVGNIRSYRAVTSGQSLGDAATLTHVWLGNSLRRPTATGINVYRDTKTGALANQIQISIATRDHEVGETVKYWVDAYPATAGPAFTVDAGNDVFTSSGHGLVAGDVIALSTTGTLPSPLHKNRHYYLRDINTNTFKLSATLDGPAINILHTGTGTHKFTRRVRHMPATNIGTFNPAVITIYTPNDTPPPDGEWQDATTAGSAGWDSTITTEWTGRNDVIGDGPGAAGSGISAAVLALITEPGAELEFTLGTVDYEPGSETSVYLATPEFALNDSATIYRLMKFTLFTDGSLPTSKAGSRRWKLTIHERIGGTLTLVYTDPDLELPGMRYRMQLSGSELRYYRDYGGPNSTLLYRSTAPLILPLRPRLQVDVNHVIENIKIGGLPESITTYPDTDMIADFGTQPATVRFRVYEERLVEGISLLGDASDFIT